jgi:hypothetical protein
MSCSHLRKDVITDGKEMQMTEQPLQKLKVSPNRRYLVRDNGTNEGKPFFYLADTGWELFTKLKKQEVETYLQVRKSQGFNVIMAIAHNELGNQDDSRKGIKYPNQEGHTPFLNDSLFFDPEGVTDEYWQHVDWVFSKAESYGIYIAFLPYWGNLYAQKEREYIINTPDMAYQWGYFLGNRFSDHPNIIWVLGGDYSPSNYYTGVFDEEEYMVTIATAEGIADGVNGAPLHYEGGEADYSTTLMTYHINEGLSSSKYFHHEEFLDFNGIQSGHHYMNVARNHQIILEDYKKVPIKPTIELEPWYEYIMVRKNGKWELPRCSDFDVRRNAYRSVLAGGMGFTYGNNNVWMFFKAGRDYSEKYNPTNNWDSNEGIYSDGANQMKYLKHLFLSRPFYKSFPTDSLVTDPLNQKGVDAGIQAAIADDHSFGVIYIQSPQEFSVNLSKLTGGVVCWWYNPENGDICRINGKKMSVVHPFIYIPEDQKRSRKHFTSPSGQDWVLVLDDKSKGYPPPGEIPD